jgi:hypothetical protein
VALDGAKALRLRAAYRNPDALLGEVDLQVPY